jgi:hypothetical protein
VGKHISCHFAIPEWMKGRRILSSRRAGAHLLTVELSGARGEYDVPDWYVEQTWRD